MQFSLDLTLSRASRSRIMCDLLRLMLREWLDVNLPPIIERAVSKKIDKIAVRS